MNSDTHSLLQAASNTTLTDRGSMMENAVSEDSSAQSAAASANPDALALVVGRLVANPTPLPHTGKQITIVTGDQTHARAIARIYNDSLPLEQPHHHQGNFSSHGRVRERSHLHPLTGDVLNAWIAQHAAATRPLWVAMRANKPVGWLSFLGMSDRPGLAYTAELAIYVSKEAQHSGVGSHLVAAAISEAPGMGLDRLMVMIWGSNQPSLNLFQRYGFKHWGCLPGAVWAHDISHDMIILGRHIAKTH
jgi:L-amino acid N-acyltransferase YncA